MICNALRHAALLVLPSTLQCDMRWSQKHKRPLLPEKLLCAMGMPVLQRFAEMCGSTTAQLENLSHSAKVPGAVDSAGLPSRLSLLVFPWGFDVISFWCYFSLSVVFLMLFFKFLWFALLFCGWTSAGSVGWQWYGRTISWLHVDGCGVPIHTCLALCEIQNVSQAMICLRPRTEGWHIDESSHFSV